MLLGLYIALLIKEISGKKLPKVDGFKDVQEPEYTALNGPPSAEERQRLNVQ